MKQAGILNWSGGKDCCLALHRLYQAGEWPAYLLSTFSESHHRLTMHGVRRKLVEAQAQSLGLPLEAIDLPENPDMATYNRLMAESMQAAKAAGQQTYLFGDIFLEDLRQYREKELAQAGLKARFPLWGQDTRQLMEEFVAAGFRGVVVAADAQKLGEEFVGRALDLSFLADLPAEVDPCGENGEFHSFVYQGPLFPDAIPFSLGERHYREYPAPSGQAAEKAGFWFQDLVPG